MPEDKNPSQRWRLLAREAFAIADQVTDPETRAMMLRIAAGYDRLAEMAEKHAKVLADLTPPPDPEPLT